MRVLIVAAEAEERTSRQRDLERAGLEVCGACDAAVVTARARASRPDALLVVATGAAGATSALRLLLARARSAGDAPLPAVVLLDDASVWLRTALPEDLAPVTALAATEADGARLAAAFDALAAGAPPAGEVALGAVVFSRSGHRLHGSGGEVALTPSETAVLALLAAEPGAFVAPAAFARALWGEPLTDRHARGAIRSHVYTLRAKLVAAGLDGVIEARSGVGYRLLPGSA